MNCSAIESALVMEELGRVLCVEPYWAVAIQAAQTLLASNDPKARAVLQAMGEGMALPVLAHEEAPARGELAFVQTRAFETAQGRWRLNGEKVAVVGGNIAELFIVSVRTSGAAGDRDGITLFLLDAKTVGIDKRNVRLIDNRWASHLVFTNVEVTEAQVLGKVGDGYAALSHANAHAMVGLFAEAVGVMEQSLWITRDYLKIRKQFGQTLSNFQSLQHRMSEMLIGWNSRAACCTWRWPASISMQRSATGHCRQSRRISAKADNSCAARPSSCMAASA